ncbi:MAG: periplasmic heavy metal sensor [Deltaproteobacteria bacterium]|nr:periplasmic heavy metal sensor [Deltaproteobacteria bacterium]
MKRTVFSIVAGVVAAVGLLFWGVGHAHRSSERRMAWIAKRLNLDEQQKLKLEAVHEAMRQAREQFHQERAELFGEVAAQLQSEQLDQAKLLQLLEQRQAMMSQVAPQVIATVAELHASLTPEQKAKAVEHLEHFKDRMGHHDHHSHH